MRRRLPHLPLLITLCAALVLATVGVVWLVAIERIVVAQGRLAGGSIAVRAPFDARVQTVLVRSGQEVEPGVELVRLETASLETQAQAASARIEGLLDRSHALGVERGRLVKDMQPVERDEAERAVRRAKLELERTEHKEQAMRQLERDGLITKLELEDAVVARQLAAVALEGAEQAVPALAARQLSRLEQIGADLVAIDARLTEERAMERELREHITQSTLVAPAAGVITSTPLGELTGQAVERGQELLRLAVGPAERFEGVLGDHGRAVIHPGLGAKIRLEGYPWLLHGTALGRVAVVSERRGEGGGFPVEIELDRATDIGRLFEGMHGEARIVVEDRVSLARLVVERLTGSR